MNNKLNNMKPNDGYSQVVRLKYSLTNSENGYGIMVIKTTESGDEINQFRDISHDKNKVIEIINRLYEGQTDLSNLDEIMEDIVVTLS